MIDMERGNLTVSALKAVSKPELFGALTIPFTVMTDLVNVTNVLIYCNMMKDKKSNRN